MIKGLVEEWRGRAVRRGSVVAIGYPRGEWDTLLACALELENALAAQPAPDFATRLRAFAEAWEMKGKSAGRRRAAVIADMLADLRAQFPDVFGEEGE